MLASRHKGVIVPCEGPVMSRLPRLSTAAQRAGTNCARLAMELAASCAAVRFAGPLRVLRGSRTIALELETFDNYCARIGAARVTSGEALLAEPIGAPRIWTCVAPPPIIDQRRIITVDGVRQPWFASALSAYPSTRQAYLHARSAIIYPRPGLIMAEMGAVYGNLLPYPQWVPDHRLTPGFVDFRDGKLVAHEDKLHPRGHVCRAVLVLCHAFHRNYAHWLFDCLPSLLPWRGPLQQGRLAVLVPPLVAWQRRTLELLGVPETAVIETPEPSVLCENMIVPGLSSTDVEPTNMSKSCRFLPQPGPAKVEAIQILRAGICPAAATDSPKYIYISRRDIESFRCMRNEDEVELAMMRLGFAVVRPEDLSFDEQVATFARARIIAGPHGAGLSNAVFAPPGCLVVEICADSWTPEYYARLTQLFQHNYLPVTFPSDGTLSQPIFIDHAIIGQSHFYTVDTNMLIAILANVMRTLRIEPSR